MDDQPKQPLALLLHRHSALRWREIRKLAEIHRNRRLSQSIVRLVGGHHSQRSTKGGTVSIPSQGLLYSPLPHGLLIIGDVLLRTANNRRCAIYAPLILAQSVCDWRLCSSARFAGRVLVCVCACVCMRAHARVCVCSILACCSGRAGCGASAQGWRVGMDRGSKPAAATCIVATCYVASTTAT